MYVLLPLLFFCFYYIFYILFFIAPRHLYIHVYTYMRMFVCIITTIKAHSKTLKKRAMTRFILRLHSGASQALFRRYYGCIQALLRRYYGCIEAHRAVEEACHDSLHLLGHFFFFLNSLVPPLESAH